jgi:hypothetical protein
VADDLNEITIVVRAVNATRAGLTAAEVAAKESAAAQKAAAAEAAAAQKAADAEAVASKKAAAAEIKATVESEALAEKAAAAEVLAAQRAADAEAVAAKKAALAAIREQVMIEANQEKAAAAETAAAAEAASSRAAAGIGALVAAVAFGAVAVKMGAEFTSSMEQIHTQAGVAQSTVDSLSGSVLGLAGKVATGPGSLAEALYHVESSFASTGITSQRAMTILQGSAQLAKIGNANLVDTTNALDAAVVAGIPGVQNMDQALGALNATVGSGDMKMQDLANAFGTGVVAQAKVFGLTMTDVGSALALFGDNNIRGAKAGTQLAMVVKSLAAPATSKAAREELSKLGLTSGTLAKDMQTGGLNKAITDLKTHLDKAGVSSTQVGAILNTVFTKKAGAGLAIMIDQFDRLESKYTDITKGANSFADAWAAYTDTVTYKWHAFVAATEAGVTKLGLALAPMAKDMLGGLTDGLDQAEPLLESIGAIMANVAKIAEEAFSGFKPVLGVAVMALSGFLKVLEGLTGFIASHKTTVEAFALLFGMSMAKNLIMGSEAAAMLVRVLSAGVAAVRTFALAYAAFGAEVAVTTGLSAAAAGVRNLAAAMMTWSNTALVAATAGILVYQHGMSNINAANDAATASVASMTQGFDAFDTKGAQQMLDQLRLKASGAAEEGKKYGGLVGTFKLGWDALTGGDSTKVAAGGAAAAKAYAGLSQQMTNAKANVDSLSKATGLSASAIQSAAQSAGVDLTQAFDQSGKARLAVIEDIQKMSSAAQTSAASMVQAVGSDTDAVEALAKALQDAQAAAGQAFRKDTDVITGWQSPSSVKASASASDAVVKAQDAVTAAQKRMGDGAKITATHQFAVTKAGATHAETTRHATTATDALAKAQENLAKAQAKAGKASSSPGGGSLTDYYKKTLASARNFNKELSTAEAKGLDPQLIGRLIAAGPAAAKPMLDAIAKDATGGLVKMVNNGEAELSKLSAFAIEQARLTAMATSATATAQFSLDYSKAARISSEYISTQGAVTADQLAAKMHIPVSEINRIADEFTIGLQHAIDANPLSAPRVTESNSKTGGRYVGSTFVPGHAAGGPAGGLTTINEQGQEAVRLPSGSMVYPHANTVTHNETHPVIVNVGTVITKDSSTFVDWSRSTARFSAGGVQ